jgi:hypothetical protein
MTPNTPRSRRLRALVVAPLAFGALAIAAPAAFAVTGTPQPGTPQPETPQPPTTPPPTTPPPTTPPPTTPPLATPPPPTPGVVGKPICLRPSLRVSITGPRNPIAGQQLTLRVKVRNASGANVARRSTLRVVIPSGYSLVRRPAGARVSGSSVRFALGTIGTRANRTKVLRLRIDRNAAGRRAVRAFANAACSTREVATLNARVAALGPGGQPAVTG